MAASRALKTKASIHHALDDPEAATAANLEASRLLDAAREPRLVWGIAYNLVSDLLHLGRAQEAKSKLPEIRAAAERLGGERDLLLMTWLEAKVAAGLGEMKSARAGLEQVRRSFQEPESSYDFALVSLDLSLVLLQQGEARRVRTIAEEMIAILRSQQIHSEALKAFRVFCEAARRDAATLDLTRRIARFLHRAKCDPELRFEAGTR